MEFLTSHIEAKSLKENGEISGYASVFNVKDGYNDVTLRGAFAKAVNNFKAGRRPKLLWQHDASAPIGVIEEMHEDEHGLFIRCRLLLEIEKAREAYALLKCGAIDGFSIGYKIKDSYFYNGARYLADIELLEISIVTFPACKEATIENVKNDENQSTDISNYIHLIKNISNKIKNLMKGKNNE